MGYKAEMKLIILDDVLFLSTLENLRLSLLNASQIPTDSRAFQIKVT